MLRRPGFSVSRVTGRRAGRTGIVQVPGSWAFLGRAVTINGIPLHPLVVHAAVVLVPLAALFAILYAVLPARRWQTRTPAAVLAVGAALAVQLASMTGDQLQEKLDENTSLIQTHEQWAGLLQAAMWVLAALMVIGWWALPHGTRSPTRTIARA